eukprot:TRINITY_DN10779_c0_g1_i1.p1 TRINITY_DN10779_c0_g1~~TRINITY_DN10779_c0_g1_i1.p1  ORF type:complete len:307 (+),score=36.31 TRINITY_DN10779_c0_g1_i1:89-1009(+)
MQRKRRRVTRSQKEEDPAVNMQKQLTELEEKKKQLEAEMEKMNTLREAWSDIVQLNVGGTCYTTSRDTLIRRQGTMLSAMFSGKYVVVKDENGRAFIDRDGELFAHVLSFLRNGDGFVEPIDAFLKRRVQAELIYFGLIEPDPLPQPATVRFDPSASSESFTINRNRTVATHNSSDGRATVLGATGYSEGRHSWKVELTCFSCTEAGEPWCAMGVIKKPVEDMKDSWRTGCGFACDGSIYPENLATTSFPEWRQGDILEFVLDFDANKISFTNQRNGCGDSKQIPPKGVLFPWFSLLRTGTSITIL